MEPIKKKFKMVLPYEPTSVLRCNAAIEESLHNAPNKENDDPSKEDLKQISSRCDEIKDMIKKQEVTLAKHSILLERIANKIFPMKSQYKIFPIKSMDYLKAVDEKLEDALENELITYIKELIGRAPLPKCFDLFFGPEVILQISWEGSKSLFPVKTLKLFNTYLFEAVKTADFGFPGFELAMKKGFRLATNRYYKKTFNLKTKIKNVLKI